MNIKSQRKEIFTNKEHQVKQWFVLYVKSRHEKVINEVLTEEGFKTYLPLKKELKIRSNRKKWVEEPVFKSYIFIKIYKKELIKALKVKDVVTYIRFAGEAAVVREKDLFLIKDLLLNKTSFEVQKGEISIGNEITIKSGNFKGYSGLIIELRGRKNFVVKLDKIGANLVVPINEIVPPNELTSQNL